MHRKIGYWLVSSLAIAVLTLSGCTLQAATDNEPGASTSPPVAQVQPDSNLPKLSGMATVVMTVKGAPITIEVNGDKAPITSGNFVDLVDRQFYDGISFHRVVDDFVAQG